LLRNDKSYLINLSVLYRTGGGPVILQDGDRLIVDNRFNRVFVIGEFETQKAVSLSAGEMTLADAMAAVGGLDLDNADTGSIFVIRGNISTVVKEGGISTVVSAPTVYHLDAKDVDALILADQFRLQPRDVVYAAPASLVNFNRALAQLTPSIDALFRTAVIYNQLND
jgi:polysaccharide export outer membrane protein